MIFAPAPPAELVTYSYSYPHKSCYRPLRPPLPLADAWRDEDQSGLSLYLHIPFCEMRCGFCNLFTHSQPREEMVAAYLSTLRRQMSRVREILPGATFDSLALGGGTPTHLSSGQLAQLLHETQAEFGFRIADVPTSVETSPATATDERLAILREAGVRRISVGVQSFDHSDTRGLGRPQRGGDVNVALDRIRRWKFPILNLDLIYGAVGQSLQSWMSSVETAVAQQPEELYLYPLYVRPETGLAGGGRGDKVELAEMYSAARDELQALGYAQRSLRCFQRPAAAAAGGEYSGIERGMLGLGCGARSYTSQWHYATRFAVRQAGVQAILRDWIAQPDDELALATHGVQLDATEQRRRLLLLGLLRAEGLELDDYCRRFSSSPFDEFPELAELRAEGWLQRDRQRLALTQAGLDRSDWLGPRLYSASVREAVRQFAEG